MYSSSMIDTPPVDIRALAELARLELSDEEITTLEKEIPHVLTFVETIQNVDVSHTAHDTSLRNVMRTDTDPHESGRYTDVLLDAAPSRVGDRIAVKQVISRKK